MALETISRKYSLFELLDLFSLYQDKVNSLTKYPEFKPEFRDYDQFMTEQSRIVKRLFEVHQKTDRQRKYFYDVIYPLVFRSIQTSILEYQSVSKATGELLDA